MDLLHLCQVHDIKEFVGNRFIVRKLYDAVNNGKNVVILGPTGCGKTTLCDVFRNKVAFKSHFDVSKDTVTSNQKDTIINIKSYILNKTIDSFFNTRNNKRAIFIDDFDIITNTDKTLYNGLLTEVIPLALQHKVQLIITCVTDFQFKKKIQEVIKDIEVVKLSYPNPKETYSYLINVLDSHVEGKEERLLELVNKYKGNIRDVLLHLNSVDDNETHDVEWKDLSSFDIVKKLFHKTRITDADVNYICKNDALTILYLIFENIPEYLVSRIDKVNSTNISNIYLRIIQCFTCTAELETYAYSSTDWKLFEISCNIRLRLIQNVLNELTPSQIVSKDDTLRFAQLLSKMSHSNIFGKKMKNIHNRSMVCMDAIYHLLDKVARDENLLKKKTDDFIIASTYAKYFASE